MGARRHQLVRQLLTESLLLCVLGGVAGTLFAHWGIRALLAWSPMSLPLAQDVEIDLRVLSFTAAVSLVAALLFGLAPAWQMRWHDLSQSIQSSGQARGGHFRSQGLQRTLIGAEVAMSLVLLISAGLLIQSFMHVMNVNTGYRTDRLLVMNLSFASPKYSTEGSADAFVRDLLGRIESVPGVDAVGFSFGLPLAQGVSIKKPFKVVGRPENTGEDPYLSIRLRIVSPNYFTAMAIPLLKDRPFSAAVRSGNAETHEVLLNESAARKAFQGEDPIGKQCNFGQIVGVVADTLEIGLDKSAEPQFYIAGHSGAEAFLVVRTFGDLEFTKSAVMNEIAAVDKELPVHNLKTMEQMVADSVRPRKFQMTLLAAFAACAVLLTVLGVYGVAAYSVAQRTREIGIRMALGAQAGDVLKLVISESVRPALLGVVIGVLGAFAAARILASQLFGLTVGDPLLFSCIPLVLLLAVLMACWFPARRAARVDPLSALRYE